MTRPKKNAAQFYYTPCTALIFAGHLSAPAQLFAAEFTGYLSLTTDYVYRGVIRSDSHGAVQLGADLLRLQDDTAFIREITGINFAIPDRVIQAGFEAGPWSAQVSATNGSGGGSEIDTDKQVSLIARYVRPLWRVGVSANSNNADVGDRQIQNIFFGLKTGPVIWVAEADLITDDLFTGGERDAVTGLLEANWLLSRGHNVKVSYDYFDPDDDVSENLRRHTAGQLAESRRVLCGATRLFLKLSRPFVLI